MAGHSKWANIQHRKKAQDAKRGKIFTRLVREISVAAREGGGDADSNPRLRLAIDKANGANVPKDNIERAIKKATGDLEGASYEELRYEGYAPGGVAVMVDCLTDNRNRTVSEVRHAFNKHGGNLGTDGSVAFQFEKKGVITFAPDVGEDKVMEAALEAGAEDIVNHEDGAIEVLTEPEAFEAVRDAFRAAGLEFEEAEVTERPNNLIEVDAETGRKVLNFLDVLEDLDDTQNVWSNADIPAEAYE
ncbi:YebC/PmpR family DNA-binding transcriptional regulator [Wenzhouxiangella sp. EGI_FJ10409]|uniref:YebC/PmpR family DNA-binding transcriptional regulator n=1 Tax=Wenzhouxiangella sp. EGI_FJ10409 TaxID=3243767 RepID=UPI0035D65C43